MTYALLSPKEQFRSTREEGRQREREKTEGYGRGRGKRGRRGEDEGREEGEREGRSRLSAFLYVTLAASPSVQHRKCFAELESRTRTLHEALFTLQSKNFFSAVNLGHFLFELKRSVFPQKKAISSNDIYFLSIFAH